MASSPTHFYRLEISAGHTGGAFRYCSEIAGTLGEIKEAIVGEAGNAQGLSFLLGEDCTFELELHEDGKKLGAWNLYPALTLRLPRGKTLAFLPSGAIEGVLEEDPGMLFEDPVIGPILAGEVEPTPVVDFTVLHLPTPRGKPLARGSEATFERDGRTETQAYGRHDDWDDSAHRPSVKAARAKAAAKKAARLTERSGTKSTTSATKLARTAVAKPSGAKARGSSPASRRK